jgi:hypothetical protein
MFEVSFFDYVHEDYFYYYFENEEDALAVYYDCLDDPELNHVLLWEVFSLILGIDLATTTWVYVSCKIDETVNCATIGDERYC